jgi:hypothetical protein
MKTKRLGMRRLAFIAPLFVLASAALGAQQPSLLTPPRGRSVPAAPASPRMTELLDRLGQGDSTTLARFWERAAVDRTPIIEPIPGDSTRVLATFVYRDTAALSNMASWPGPA